MTMDSIHKLIQLYRACFYSFAFRAYVELFPGKDYHHNWHIELLTFNLELARLRQTRRLCIHMPPRHSKSFIMAVVYPAWILGHHPSAHVFLLSYGQQLSEEHAFLTRRLMLGDFYRAVFPTRIAKGRDSVADFFTTDGGRLLAESFNGVLTGRGADFILIDDPLKASDAYSEARRHNVNENMYKAVASRLNNQDDGVIILAMQRLHPDDLAGYLQAKGGWDALSLPLIAETDERFEIINIFGRRVVGRKAGDVLQPKIVSLETAAQIRRENPDHVFSAQWQQRPQPPGGNIVKREDLRFYRPHELPRKFDRIIQSWDTANKDGKFNDFSACTTWGVSGNKIYLLSVFRRRLNFPNLRLAVIEQANLYNATVVLIEDKASGTQLIQDLRNDGFSRVQPAPKMDGDKVMRLHSQTGRIAGGFVFFPEDAYWLQEYLAELLFFPNTTFADQVDSTVYALEYHFTAPRYGWTDKGVSNYARILDNGDVHPLATYFSRRGLL